MALPSLTAHPDLNTALKSDADALVLVSRDPGAAPSPLGEAAQALFHVDQSAKSQVRLGHAPDLPGGRLILAPTGDLEGDVDDVREIGRAAKKGLARAVEAGARNPLLVLGDLPAGEDYTRAYEVAILEALGGIWQPLEARESLGEEKVEPLVGLGVVSLDKGRPLPDPAHLVALEEGRRFARDLGGSNPERMSPPHFAESCVLAFQDTPVQVEVVSDPEVLRQQYPLLHAVARASLAVERHQPRVIRLHYRPEGDIQETLLFAGKGLTYDTGGSDLKTGGHMAGMSRDKGGAAAVAGLFLAAAKIQPKGIELIAEIGAVRNSIGADAFVSDEILTSHAGCRVRVGNTDAEGRLVLADLLSQLRVQALERKAPRLFTLATLTGHAGLAVGCYTTSLDNGPARSLRISQDLEALGDLWGDCFELSRLRKEDFDFIRPRTQADDVLSCNNAPSSQTPRGHHFPMAFLIRAAGLEGHGKNSDHPLPFTHIDVGGSACEAGDWQHGRPTGAPILALAAKYFSVQG